MVEILGQSNISSVSAIVTMLKARLLDIRHNQKKAEEDVIADPAVFNVYKQAYLNNLGVLAFHRKRVAAAFTYFTHAAQVPAVAGSLKPLLLISKLGSPRVASAASTGKSKRPRLIYSDDSSAEIAFNSGIQLIALKRFADAKKCFEYVAANFGSTTFASNPLLWIRWGECCLQSYNQTVRLHSSVWD